MFTRQHKAIAEIIKESTDVQKPIDLHGQFAKGVRSVRVLLHYRFAQYFAADNPKFDSDKFHKACCVG